MTNTIEKFQETALAGTIMIAQNICNQIIAFQNAISSREEGLRFPDAKEVSLLVKLINCLDKIRKMWTATQSCKEMNAFIRHLENSDKELAKNIRTRYKEYMAQNQTNTLSGVPFSPDELTQDQLTREPVYPATPATSPSHFEPTQPQQNNIQPQKAAPATRPLSRWFNGNEPVAYEEFNRYSYLLDSDKLRLPPDHQTLFRAMETNTNWLQYNLFQYCLDPGVGLFHYNEKTYHQQINHLEYIKKIDAYFNPTPRT